MNKYNSILGINDILNDYSHDIQDAITERAIEVAKDGQKKLKSTSPINKKNTSNKGRYAKGWKVKTTKGHGFVNCIIYNATDYQLTHLLEDGHLTRNGGKTTPIKHIEPINEMCAKNFEDGCIEVIRGKGE